MYLSLIYSGEGYRYEAFASANRPDDVRIAQAAANTDYPMRKKALYDTPDLVLAEFGLFSGKGVQIHRIPEMLLEPNS